MAYSNISKHFLLALKEDVAIPAEKGLMVSDITEMWTSETEASEPQLVR